MITLEICNTEVRLLETAGGRVVKWASSSLEPGTFEDEVLSNPEALGAAVRRLMASSGISGRNVTASVSGIYSLSRIVLVPNTPGEQVKTQAVMDAASEVMPLSEDEQYISWQSIATTDEGQQVQVVGVPRDVIDSEVQSLRAAGINPRVLDLKTMALARVVNREQALILNIEPSSFDVVIVAGGIAEVIRSTAWQQDDLSVEEKAEHLAQALELTVGFYNTHHPASPFELATPLFVTGQMSGDLALMEELRTRLGCPIEALTPPLEYPEHLPVSQYAVNIGLALKGKALSKLSKNEEQTGYSIPDINLLPPVYRPWRPSARQIQAFCALIASIVLLFPMYQVVSGAKAETATLEKRYNIINNELLRRQVELKKREPLQRAIDEYHTIVNMGVGFADDIEVIHSRAAELGVEVLSIGHTGDSVNIACRASDGNYLTFRSYIVALEESGRFSTPVTPPEGFPYIISGDIRLKPKAGE